MHRESAATQGWRVRAPATSGKLTPACSKIVVPLVEPQLRNLLDGKIGAGGDQTSILPPQAGANWRALVKQGRHR